MRRIAARLTILFLLATVAGGWAALAAGVGFSGSVGLETTFTPIPPLSYNIESELSLGLRVADFGFSSKTAFDLVGFRSQELGVSVELGPVRMADTLLFDPYFSRNALCLDTSIISVTLGLDLILAYTDPDYSVGAVLELSSRVANEFSITTLTGFGAQDLVNLLEGVEAPFSHDLLSLFVHLATFYGPPPVLSVTIVPGLYFEEELVRLEVDTSGILLSSTTWLSWTGFEQEILEFGYRFEEPKIAFLTALTVDDTFAISALHFVLDAEIEGVVVSSWTTFSQPLVPPIPVVFSGQGFAVSFELLGARITTETDFDGSFLFERQLVAIEATVDPVAFSSLTAFDAGGFSGQWVTASVTFSGVALYTRAAFDSGGIGEVVFGFTFTF
ncbi:MAG: hypothetical protein NT125_02235 [Candidatus Bipolaricaulota bacterium]|nr:hypothetical protein [Candidatus Bipolaricaulota bacterium]